MDLLLQTLDLGFEVFLFLGVVPTHHGESFIIQLSGNIVLINADEQTVLLNLQNSKHSRCKLHSAIFAKSSLLANSINGVSKQCTAVPTRAKTCWGAGRQWRPQNAMHFEALDRAGRRDHPKPFNNFREIGCAPLVLFLVKIVIRQSRLLWFSLFRDFLAIGSWEGPLHSHGAKIGTKIIRAGLHHSLLDGSKLFFVYKKFDLYRSLAIPVIWQRYRPPNFEYAL